MRKCIIVGSCVDSQKEFKYGDDDFIIASDGGLEYLHKMNYRVDLVIGDFDSLGYIPSDCEVIQLNPEKDITDTDACIEEAIKRGYSTFEIYGCLGGRIDHSLAIIQTVMHFKEFGHDFTIYGKDQTLLLVKDEEVTLDKKGGYLSVFSLSRLAEGVTLKNVKYELDNVILRNDFPLGVSNEFINKKATISVASGMLLVIY
jgi:thiamine pyrophosphokinase